LHQDQSSEKIITHSLHYAPHANPNDISHSQRFISDRGESYNPQTEKPTHTTHMTRDYSLVYKIVPILFIYGMVNTCSKRFTTMTEQCQKYVNFFHKGWILCEICRK
jgi:hypothetical protein